MKSVRPKLDALALEQHGTPVRPCEIEKMPTSPDALYMQERDLSGTLESHDAELQIHEVRGL